LIDLIPPFHNNLNHAKIEPLNLPQEKLDELKTILADPKKPDLHKHMMKRSNSGTCLICGQMPSHIAKYRMYGAIVIERYCNECLARMQT
jgi:hypothetical protein